MQRFSLGHKLCNSGAISIGLVQQKMGRITTHCIGKLRSSPDHSRLGRRWHPWRQLAVDAENAETFWKSSGTPLAVKSRMAEQRASRAGVICVCKSVPGSFVLSFGRMDVGSSGPRGRDPELPGTGQPLRPWFRHAVDRPARSGKNHSVGHGARRNEGGNGMCGDRLRRSPGRPPPCSLPVGQRDKSTLRSVSDQNMLGQSVGGSWIRVVTVCVHRKPVRVRRMVGDAP